MKNGEDNRVVCGTQTTAIEYNYFVCWTQITAENGNKVVCETQTTAIEYNYFVYGT